MTTPQIHEQPSPSAAAPASWEALYASSLQWPDLSAHGLQLLLDIEREDGQWRYSVWAVDMFGRHQTWLKQKGFEPSQYQGLWRVGDTSVVQDTAALQAAFPKVRWQESTLGELCKQAGQMRDNWQHANAPDLSDFDEQQAPAARKRPRSARSLIKERIFLGVNAQGEQVFQDSMGKRMLQLDTGVLRETKADNPKGRGNPRFLRAPDALFHALHELWNHPGLGQMDSRQACQVMNLHRMRKDLRPLVAGLANQITRQPVSTEALQAQFCGIFGQSSLSYLHHPRTPGTAWMPLEALQQALDEELSSRLERWQGEHPRASVGAQIQEATVYAQNRPVWWRLPSGRPLPLGLDIVLDEQSRKAQQMYAAPEGEEIPFLKLPGGVPSQTIEQVLPASSPEISHLLQCPYSRQPEVLHQGLALTRPDYLAALTHLQRRNPQGQTILLLGQEPELPAGDLNAESRAVLNHIARHWHLEGAWDMEGSLLTEGDRVASGMRMLLVGPRRPRALRNVPEIDGLPVITSFAGLYEHLEGPGGVNMRTQWRLRQAQAGKTAVDAQELPAPQLDLFAAPAAQTAAPAPQAPAASHVPNPQAPSARGEAAAPVAAPEGTPQAAPSTAAASLEPAALEDTGTGEDEVWQVPYKARSRVGRVSTMSPRNLQVAAHTALTRMEKQSGMTVDNFVCKELNWNMQELSRRLSPEQVDAVALALWKLKNDKNATTGDSPAFLLGDNTGVGKGRTLATIATWLRQQDKPFIFLTDNASLFRDFYRDIDGIEQRHLFQKPLLLSPSPLEAENGTLIARPPSRAEQSALFSQARLPEGYDFVMASYSQFNRKPLSQEDYSLHQRAWKLLNSPEPLNSVSYLKTMDAGASLPQVWAYSAFTPNFWDDFRGYGGLLCAPADLQKKDNCWLTDTAPDCEDCLTQTPVQCLDQLIEDLAQSLDTLLQQQAQGKTHALNPCIAPPASLMPGSMELLMPKPPALCKNFSSVPMRERNEAQREVDKLLTSAPAGITLTELPAERTQLRFRVQGLAQVVPQGEEGPICAVIAQTKYMLQAAHKRLAIHKMTPAQLQEQAEGYLSKNLQSLRVNWLLQPGVAQRQAMLADESHKAASPTSQTGQNLVQAALSSPGIVYASATSISKVSNIAFYTPLLPKGYTPEETQSILSAGGLTLEEIFAQSLSAKGSYLRREIGNQGVEFRNEVALDYERRNIEWNDRVADVLAACAGVSLSSLQMERELNEQALKQAMAQLKVSRPVNAAGTPLSETALYKLAQKSATQIQTLNSTSRLYGINRMLQLAMCSDHVADCAIEALRKGQKPVILMESTGEAALAACLNDATEAQRAEIEDKVRERLDKERAAAQAAAQESEEDEEEFESRVQQAVLDELLKLRPGKDEALLVLDKPLTLRDALLRMTDSLLLQIVRTPIPQGGFVSRVVPNTDPELQAEAQRIRTELIPLVPDIPLCGIDYIRQRLEAEGYSVGELTGRKLRLQTDENGQQRIERNRTPNGTPAKDAFNNGSLDVLMVTRAGGTGHSMHSSPQFGDSSQRIVIEAQAAASVAARIQAWGRVHRKDQVIPPIIVLVSSGLPGETRLNLLLANSLKQMSANVTGNSSNMAQSKAADYLNWVGDQCVRELLKEKPQWRALFQTDERQLAETGDQAEQAEDDSSPSDTDPLVRLQQLLTQTSHGTWAVDQVTKRLPLLHAHLQTEVTEEISRRFEERMDEFEQMGVNPLGTSHYGNWNALADDSLLVQAARDRDNPFEGAVYLTRLLVNENRKPDITQRLHVEAAFNKGRQLHEQALQTQTAPEDPQAEWAFRLKQETRTAQSLAQNVLRKGLDSVEQALQLARLNQASRASQVWENHMLSTALQLYLPQGALLRTVADPQDEAASQSSGLVLLEDSLSTSYLPRLLPARTARRQHLSLPRLADACGLQPHSYLMAHTQDWNTVKQKLDAEMAAGQLTIAARPGDANYPELLAQWQQDALSARMLRYHRHALTGNLFKAADLAAHMQTGKPAHIRQQDGNWLSCMLLPAEFTQALRTLRPTLAASEEEAAALQKGQLSPEKGLAEGYKTGGQELLATLLRPSFTSAERLVDYLQHRMACHARDKRLAELPPEFYEELYKKGRIIPSAYEKCREINQNQSYPTTLGMYTFIRTPFDAVNTPGDKVTLYTYPDPHHPEKLKWVQIWMNCLKRDPSWLSEDPAVVQALSSPPLVRSNGHQVRLDFDPAKIHEGMQALLQACARKRLEIKSDIKDAALVRQWMQEDNDEVMKSDDPQALIEEIAALPESSADELNLDELMAEAPPLPATAQPAAEIASPAVGEKEPTADDPSRHKPG